MDNETKRPMRPRIMPGRIGLFPRWTGVSRVVLTRLGREPGGALGSETAEDWALVLRARRVPARVERGGAGWEVRVPARYAAWAAEELAAYLEENPGRAALEERGEEAIPAVGSRWEVLAPYFGLLLFYLAVLKPLPALGLYPHSWLAAGSGDAAKILEGEWWRAGTALTLHADPAHALSNAVVGGAFALVLWRRAGAGLGLALTVAAGFAGNLVNALVMGPGHGSIGFSTAVFGTAGVLGALALEQGRGSLAGPRLAGALAPVAAGLGLVALLGVGEEASEFGVKVDLGAHLFGFAAGVVLGWPVGRWLMRCGPPGRLTDGLLYGLGWMFPLLCWLAPLARG